MTLGTQKFQLNRLLRQMDECIEKGLVNEEVVAQVGNSDYKPQNYKFDSFYDKSHFNECIQKSRIVITHSGVGSIITALQYKKPVIVFPRLKRYNEHVDDHQLDIARAFAQKGYILCCNDNDRLIDLIERCRTAEFKEYVSQRQNIIHMIDRFMNESNGIEV